MCFYSMLFLPSLLLLRWPKMLNMTYIFTEKWTVDYIDVKVRLTKLNLKRLFSIIEHDDNNVIEPTEELS